MFAITRTTTGCRCLLRTMMVSTTSSSAVGVHSPVVVPTAPPARRTMTSSSSSLLSLGTTSTLLSRRRSTVFQKATNRVHINHHCCGGVPATTNPSIRSMATLSESDIKKRLDEFQDLFVEARLSIEDLVESEGTKYFDEDAEAAQDAVEEALEAFQKIIDDIDNPEEKNRILRGNGLKVEQLKGELALALEGGHDH